VAEGIVAFRYHLPYELHFSVGAGRELQHSLSSADHRFFAGLTWDFAFLRDREPQAQAVRSTPLPASQYRRLEADLGPPDVTIAIDDILFAFDSDVIEGEPAKETLDRLAKVFHGSKKIALVVITGHACAIGEDEYNLDLSERRAESIVQWLVQRYQVRREKVVPVGFGEQKPIIKKAGKDGLGRNRRVEFQIYYENDPRL
jgi:outer membrane protein OmpA-like peptidoglycan-associated protein